ncbi:MAG TPA: DUF4215 domain-containing protein [Polyangiales bacterium]|nr:DUF4215 domain-containing protein [Polyangiales bacterium]
MRSRPVIAQLAISLALGVLCASCSVYKGDRLEDQQAQPKGPAAGRKSDAGGSAPAPDGGGAGSEGGGGDTFDPDKCLWGDCWWSKKNVDDCNTAGVPTPADRPTGADNPATVPPFYLGFSEIRVGSTNRDGKMTEDAWEDFGFDLDGTCTNSKTCDNAVAVSCKSAVPAVPFDGQLCRDNTFARLQPVIAAVPELGKRFGLDQDTFNCALHRGEYNVIARISNYNGEDTDAHVRVDFYISNGIEEDVPWECPNDKFRDYPRWRSSMHWSVDKSMLSGPVFGQGVLPDSKYFDADAYVKHGYLVARMPDGARFGFVGDGNPYRGFVFSLQQGLYVGRLSKQRDGTWGMRDGLSGGRIKKDDLVKAMREIGFCAGGELDTFYKTMVDYVNENADVLADGKVDPNTPCDAMSFAVGFEAEQLLPGMGVDFQDRLECCAPGKSVEDCTAKCGDGKLSGEEKCDTAIAAGQPGACPTSCKPTDSCTPQVVKGDACNAECTPMPISMAGAKDGCCPSGATAASDVDCAPKCGNGVVEPGETCDPPESCKACTTSNTCLSPRGTGSATSCNLRCDMVPITQCRSSDRCCPAGCNSNNDRDCSSMCGNKVIDQGETCENGTDKPCPANCEDNNPCTADRTTGSAQNCNISCTHTPITQAMTGDGCCPDGASANNDGDCMATCGNKVVEGSETCDDGNTTKGDGCFECKTETPAQRCMGTLGLDDACTQCTCNKCANQALGCYGNKDPNEVTLCKNMVQCARDKNCGNPDCFCGRYSLFSCLGGLADGQCKAEVTAAAKSGDLLTIDSRKADTNYPLGRANALGDCVEANCASECGR